MVVESTAIEIVNIESQTRTFVGIYSKVALESLFAVDLVARTIIADVGVGRLGVGEVELVGADEKEVQRISEDKLSAFAMKEYARLSWRTHVAQVVVFSVESVGKVKVLEIVYSCICGHGDDIAQHTAYMKHLYIAGYTAVNDRAVTSCLFVVD